MITKRLLQKQSKISYLQILAQDGFGNSGDLDVFNVGAKIKPQHSLSIHGFSFCDNGEDGQINGFGKLSANQFIDKK
ncbi:MAG: hypothetical protein JJU13_11810 [Balneolaceae bacterium]|jgi:hypothetical protein|nr:hypothetical protein [Balneolaceae bacterium]